jgi:hypothetical protein
MDVLFFGPTQGISNNRQILRILNSAASTNLNVDLVDENSPSFHADKPYDAVVILYTAAVEFSNTLFQIVRMIDQKKPAGRFIFLPKKDGKEIIPPIFHPIRALQLRLFYYPAAGQPDLHLEAQLSAFKEEWQKFIKPIPVERSANLGRKRRFNPIGFGLVLTASILILFLAGLLSVIIPIAQKSILSATPTSLHPPAAGVFWLQENFETIDTAARWKEQHYYTGKQDIKVKTADHVLYYSASPVVTEAVHQLDSLQSWPLDELQTLSFSFAVSAMVDPTADNFLLIGLFLSEDNSYHLDCLVIPAETEGRIQCQVQSPTQSEALSEAIPVSLNTEHTAALVFDPLTYKLQFFMDDRYYGQREIQSVEYWRNRQVRLQVWAVVRKLNNGYFSCELSSLSLTHQP